MQPSSSVVHKTVLHHGTHIFSWGRGDLGQLGTNRGQSESQPVLVQAVEDKDVAHVAASVFNSAFITGGINFCIQRQREDSCLLALVTQTLQTETLGACSRHFATIRAILQCKKTLKVSATHRTLCIQLMLNCGLRAATTAVN